MAPCVVYQHRGKERPAAFHDVHNGELPNGLRVWYVVGVTAVHASGGTTVTLRLLSQLLSTIVVSVLALYASCSPLSSPVKPQRTQPPKPPKSPPEPTEDPPETICYARFAPDGRHVML